MKKRTLFNSLAALLLCFAATAGAQTTPPVVSGKTPIIIIPGLTGSELVNAKTGEKVWFKVSRSKEDDVRLPISANLSRNRDGLVAGDIIREVSIVKILPEVEIYEKLIGAMEKSGGYREAKWDTATRADASDTFFVFPYDWRRDNVENARLLIRKIDALKRRIGKPNQKFNVIAHSMGGLITRYAAMYGNSDIPAGDPAATWAGSRYFDKVFLLGTPNEGSLLAFEALLNGVSYTGSGIKLPFVQNLSRFDVFTIPSVYQLLPHAGTLRAYDEDLKPLNIDIYNPQTWDEYDWSIWKDKDFEKKFTPAEQRSARAFFISALARAKRFQAALDANRSEKIPVSFYLIGADCKDTQNAMVLRRKEKKDRWETQFNADSYTSSTGQKITSEQLKAVLYTVGDGVVPKRSLAAETLMSNGGKLALPIVSDLYHCEYHSSLVTNAEIQKRLFAVLNAAAVAEAKP